jgi:hypothetical protein
MNVLFIKVYAGKKLGVKPFMQQGDKEASGRQGLAKIKARFGGLLCVARLG